jgi:hypothetical protein
MNGKTVCECGRDDIHSSKDCLTLEKLLEKWKDVLDYKPSEESEDEQKQRLKNSVLIESEEFHPISKELKDRLESLNELAKQAQELDMGYSVTTNSDAKYALNANELHYISFHNKENKEIGKLNFDSDKLVFEGDVEQSAKHFMDYLLMVFNNKIDKLTMDAYYRGWKDKE